MGKAASMTSSDLWDVETAERYDETSAFMFAPDVLDPAIHFLADLADSGPALELAIGTGRVAIPLVERGVSVSGIELSQPMIDQLQGKRTDIPVVVGDMATSTMPGQFSSSISSGMASETYGPRLSRSLAFATRRATSRRADDSSLSCGFLVSGDARPVRTRCPSMSGNSTSASTRTT